MQPRRGGYCATDDAAPPAVDTRAVMCVVCRRTWRMLVVERESAKGWRGVGRTVCAACVVDTRR